MGLRAGILTFRPGGVGSVSLLRSESAFYAPPAASAEMIEAILLLLEQKRVLPWAAHREGEYDLNDPFAGVPVRIGESGIEEVVELEL